MNNDAQSVDYSSLWRDLQPGQQTTGDTEARAYLTVAVVNEDSLTLRADNGRLIQFDREPGSDDMKLHHGPSACDFCGVLGIVASAVAERYRRGRAICERRKKWGLTLNQQAHILRIRPELLNDVEWGRADWPPWVNRKLLAEYGYA